MNKAFLFQLVLILTSFLNLANAQINLKIDAIPGATNSWGVYVKTCENVMPSGNTITGSGQVTFKYPSGLTIANVTSHAGTWAQNATVPSPSEANGFTYVSVGFLVDNPQIIYQPDTEMLLFSFKLNGTATGSPELIVNGVDPFDQLPNSVNSNPGNELTVLDFGVQPLGLYTYVGNYSGATLVCAEEPQDTTTTIDPPVDTTGNNDTTLIDTTGNNDTTVIDTVGNNDTTVINPPVDTTQQTSGVLDIKQAVTYFNLYPTPAYEWITVKFLDTELEGGTLRLFTLNGASLGQIARGQKGELTLNIGALPAGMYLLRYDKDGGTLQRQKFLKQ